jgi:hypothetical protein
VFVPNAGRVAVDAALRREFGGMESGVDLERVGQSIRVQDFQIREDRPMALLGYDAPQGTAVLAGDTTEVGAGGAGGGEAGAAPAATFPDACSSSSRATV